MATFTAMDFNAPSKIIIACLKRLAPYVSRELKALGFEVEAESSTWVQTRGTLNDCIKLNLNLRCASQVRFSLQAFPATTPDQVYNWVGSVDWENIIAVSGYFSVTNSVEHETVANTMFINQKVKDAIVDRIRKAKGARPNSGPELNGVAVHLHWRNSEAEIFLDTSGETLAKHSYRKIPGPAPMLEALAAATIMATGWDGSTPFVNPMCGSGTMAIEAALIATNQRPGLLRKNYSFMHVLGYDDAVYQNEITQLQTQIKPLANLEIVATDYSRDAVEIAQVNVRQAGLEGRIKFSQCDFADTPMPEMPGVVFFNPEYGERLGEVTALEKTYARLGDFLKQKCQGYKAYVFTGNLELAKKIGLKASKRLEFYSAKLDCRLLEYEMYAGSKRAPKPPISPEN